MLPIAHPGRLLKGELEARGLSRTGWRSTRITEVLNGRRGISADTALHLGRYFGNRAQLWLDLQSPHYTAVVERGRGEEIARRVCRA